MGDKAVHGRGELYLNATLKDGNGEVKHVSLPSTCTVSDARILMCAETAFNLSTCVAIMDEKGRRIEKQEDLDRIQTGSAVTVVGTRKIEPSVTSHPLKDVKAAGHVVGVRKPANYSYVPPHLARLHNSLYGGVKSAKEVTPMADLGVPGTVDKSFPFRDDIPRSSDEVRREEVRRNHYRPRFKRGFLIA